MSSSIKNKAAKAQSSSASSNDAGILMILSPAKTLDLSPWQQGATTTTPQCNAAKTREIAQIMKKRKDLVKLLGVSANVGKTAQEYWNNFQLNNDKNQNPKSKPCIYAFTGVAYKGLQIHKCSDQAVLYLQENLRIIDPLYGALRPLDVIQPYRLEMATKGVFGKDNKSMKLQDYWRESVTSSLAQDLKDRKRKIVLNIASDEYSSAVNAKGLPTGTQYIKITFLDGGRVVAVHAKRARGLMAKFVAENKCQTIDDVKAFDAEGYGYSESQSQDDCLVFERTKHGTTATKRKSSNGAATTARSKKQKKWETRVGAFWPRQKRLVMLFGLLLFRREMRSHLLTTLARNWMILATIYLPSVLLQ